MRNTHLVDEEAGPRPDPHPTDDDDLTLEDDPPPRPETPRKARIEPLPPEEFAGWG